MKISKRLPLYVFIPLFIASLMLYFTKTQKKEVFPEIQGIYLSKPEFVTPFALTKTDGTPFTDQSLLGHWSIVFFGFTYCPDICPTTLALLNLVTQEVAKEHPGIPLKVIFVSVDPGRDNLAQLDKYTHYFNPNFVGVTGNEAQLKAFAKQLGVVFDKVSVDTRHPDEYLMEHSTSLALINPKGGIQAIFTSPHQVDQMVTDLSLVLTHP